VLEVLIEAITKLDERGSINLGMLSLSDAMAFNDHEVGPGPPVFRLFAQPNEMFRENVRVRASCIGLLGLLVLVPIMPYPLQTNR
jgi:hypothetical protein